MNMLIILSTLILFTSCGKLIPDFLNEQEGGRKYNSTNSDFKSYVSRFERFYGLAISDIPINYENLPSSTLGLAISYTDGTKEIHINVGLWKHLSEGQREQVIWHELGHAELNRDHLDGMTDLDGQSCYKSIMNAYAPNDYEIDKCYHPKHNYYIDELFGK